MRVHHPQLASVDPEAGPEEVRAAAVSVEHTNGRQSSGPVFTIESRRS
jgi:hypothetical protein